MQDKKAEMEGLVQDISEEIVLDIQAQRKSEKEIQPSLVKNREGFEDLNNLTSNKKGVQELEKRASHSSLQKDEVKSPTTQELSMFDSNITHMKKNIKEASHKKKLEILLEIKDKEIQNKEDLLLKSKLELEQFKNQLDFYKKMAQDKEKQFQKRVQDLSQQLQKVIQRFYSEEERGEFFKNCIGDS